MQETVTNRAETQPVLQRNTAIAQAFLNRYVKKSDPGQIRRSLAGVIIFCFGTFVTGYATLGPGSGPRTLMSYLLPGFFLVMTVIMILELRNFYLWRHNKNAYVLKKLQKDAAESLENRYALAYAYQTGALGVQDSRLAAQWYQKAAGYAFADNDLGVCYALGEGVDQDLHKARKLFKDAARSGAMFAADNLKIVEAQEKF